MEKVRKLTYPSIMDSRFEHGTVELATLTWVKFGASLTLFSIGERDKGSGFILGGQRNTKTIIGCPFDIATLRRQRNVIGLSIQ